MSWFIQIFLGGREVVGIVGVRVHCIGKVIWVVE
jgi:hypothetical protein